MTDTFKGFGLPAKLMQALDRMGFNEPTPIQMGAIPLAMEGRDILGSAQTGTGKTGAFGIPLIAKLIEDETATALVMTPTRELAAQVMDALQQMIPVPNIPTALLIGGEAMPRQFRQLQKNPRLVVGTPGRINDHLERKSVDLSRARYLVLDETDRMLDMGFGVQLARILKYVPKKRQTMMFSATMPDNIMKMANQYLTNPERIAVGSNNTPVDRIKQELIHVKDAEKYDRLLTELDARDGSIIIFVKTKHGTDRLARKLNAANYLADAIHGDLQQRRRDRVIQNFRDKKFRILVATDVAARGLDIPHIEHVMNYDLPQAPEDYIHRIGRTARAGATGCAVNFLTPADGMKWKAIHKLIHGTVPSNMDTKGGKSGGKFESRGPKPFKRRFDNDRAAGPRGDDRRDERRDTRRSDDRRDDRRDAPRRPDNRSNNRPDNRFDNRPAEKRAEGRDDHPFARRRVQRDEADFRDSYRDEGPRRTQHADAPPKKNFGHKNPNSKFHWANKQARSGKPSSRSNSGGDDVRKFR